MKTLKLEVHNDMGKLVRRYSMNFDETEGKFYTLTLGDKTYKIDSDDNITSPDTLNFNPYFIPYD